jgi:POT family proton-dependent oligopeptide transporter
VPAPGDGTTVSPTGIRSAPDHTLTGYPPGIPFIIANEGCERFSFYGMRAMLVGYSASLWVNLRGSSMPDAELAAKSLVHDFFAWVYVFPLLGALLADRLLGKYRTILWLSILYCVGHLALAVFEDPSWQVAWFGKVYVDPLDGLWAGLFLIAVGSGGIKPCVSAHVGDQFGRGNWGLLKKIYNAFYFIINFGSFFASLFIPLIRGHQVVDPVTGHIGYSGSVAWAFGIPGILMGLATIAFWAGRHRFVHIPPTLPPRIGLVDVLAGTSLFAAFAYPIFFASSLWTWTNLVVLTIGLALFVVLFRLRERMAPDDGFFAQVLHGIVSIARGRPSEPTSTSETHWFWRHTVARFGPDAAEGPRAVFRIVGIFAFVAVFWMLFDQKGSTWIQQAERMNRHFDLGFAEFTFLSEQFLFVNPGLVMVLIPAMSLGVYPWLERRGLLVSTLSKMTVGMVIASLAYVAVALIQNAIDARGDGQVHLAWQLVPYALLTLGEVMVSVTGLEFAYSQAPKRMKSVVMGFWALASSIGNKLVVLLAGLKGLSVANFFWTCSGLMLVAALCFGLLSRRYVQRDYTQ